MIYLARIVKIINTNALHVEPMEQTDKIKVKPLQIHVHAFRVIMITSLFNVKVMMLKLKYRM